MKKELPEINVLPIHEIFLPILDIKYKFVPYTIDQERSILTAVDSDDIPAIVNNYIQLMNVCGSKIEIEKLSAMEFIMIAVNLRSKSKGEILDITTKCKKCSKTIELSVNIEDKIVTENSDVLKDICKIDDNLAFEIVPVKMQFLYALENVKTETDLMLETAVHSINKVFWKDDIFTEFTPESLKTQISLTYPILKKVFESATKLIRMTMKLEVPCMDKACGHKEEYVIRDFLKYLS